MATRYAVANGNWNDVNTWDGTTTLPASSDDVYSNGKTIQVDMDITVNTLRSTSAAGITAGGVFQYSGAANRNIIATNGFYTLSEAATGMLNIDIASPYTVTIQGNIVSNSSGRSFKFAGTGVINWTGNILAVTTGYNSGAIENSNTGTVNITGNIIGGGYVGGPIATYQWGVYHNSIGTLNITGTVTAGVACGVAVASTGPLNVTGNVTSSGSAGSGFGIYSASVCNVTVIGTIDTQAPPATIVSSVYLTQGTLIFSGTIKNRTTIMPIYVTKMLLLSAGASTQTWEMIDSTTATKILYSAGVTPLGNPAISDVRKGTTFGPALELTGTMEVPIDSQVLLGVPNDKTTGTLIMTPAGFWGYGKSSITTNGSIGVYLKATATVDSVGDQIVALMP